MHKKGDEKREKKLCTDCEHTNAHECKLVLFDVDHHRYTHSHTRQHTFISFSARVSNYGKAKTNCHGHATFAFLILHSHIDSNVCAHTQAHTHRYEFMMDFQRAADVVVIIIIFIFIHIAAVAASIVIVVVVVRPILYSTTTYMYS